MARILFIEDEQALHQVLAHHLERAGHALLSALTGGAGLTQACELGPDLILLDWMLPDLSGADVCRALKKDPKTREIPVIFVTARDAEIDRIVGFELGADDYVVKPFSVRELGLRIEAVLRRRERERPDETVARVELGRMRIDVDAHRAWVDDRALNLTLLEWKLLLALYQNRNRVLGRSTLLADVWGVDVEVTTRTIDTHVKRLRDKLGPAGAYIQTVRGIGYRLVAPPSTGAPS
jgi:two-component system phosphate regulon response regulator PhoB